MLALEKLLESYSNYLDEKRLMEKISHRADKMLGKYNKPSISKNSNKKFKYGKFWQTSMQDSIDSQEIMLDYNTLYLNYYQQCLEDSDILDKILRLNKKNFK